jgi:hypothetical protein
LTNKPNIDDSLYGTSGPIMAVPKQSINMGPVNTMQGVQIQQLKVIAQQPTQIQTPINIQRVVSGTGYQFSVQFMRDPTNPLYAGTSVAIKTNLGTTALQASGGSGPIVFSSPRSSAPSSIATSVSTTAGTSSSTSFGGGNSRPINQT